MTKALKQAALLLQFGFRPIRGTSHAERLESFYGYQASDYDAYRKTFLRGRDEMVGRLGIERGTHWADLGCGTGYLIEAAGDSARECERIWLVDLTSSLLAVARQRVSALGLGNTEVIEADITEPMPIQVLDCVSFSYSLSMTPNWFAAIDQAHSKLKPGGRIGVADFFVSRKHPVGVTPRQGWITRQFWPLWFSWDNVHPSADHIPYLESKFHINWFHHERTRVPGLPLLRPPCYQLIGTKL